MGHITELAKGGIHGLGVDINNHFKPHYSIMPDKLGTVDMLLEEASKVDQVILAGDDDREGTAICWHVADRISSLNKPCLRAKFKTITEKGVKDGLKNAAPIDMNEVNAQKTRQILDRIVGFTASPFLMNTFGGILSAGRVQSVVTGLVIEREKEIKSFVPEAFWTIKGQFTDGTTPFSANFSRRITEEEDAKTTIAAIHDTKAFVVTSVIADDEKRAVPAPLVTSTLQKTMSKNHGIQPDETMKAAQSLYENGRITYLRTDSVRASDDAIEEAREYLKDNNHVIPKKAWVHKNKDAAQDAHECLRPTDVTKETYPSLSKGEAKVYDVIRRYFLASQMNPVVYSTLKVSFVAEQDKNIEFKASGKALKDPGFYAIMGVSDAQKIEIPSLSKKDKLSPVAPALLEKKMTQPPPRYTNHSLIDTMEKKGIGRPSTYAESVTKITARNYVDMVGSTYRATDLGMKISSTLEQFFSFMDVNFTAEMEKKLDLISEGKIDAETMLTEFYPGYKKELQAAYEANGAIFCEKCGEPMVTRTTKDKSSQFLACSGYPKCRNSRNLP